MSTSIIRCPICRKQNKHSLSTEVVPLTKVTPPAIGDPKHVDSFYDVTGKHHYHASQFCEEGIFTCQYGHVFNSMKQIRPSTCCQAVTAGNYCEVIMMDRLKHLETMYDLSYIPPLILPSSD